MASHRFEDELLVKVQAAAQQLRDQGQKVTRRSIGEIVGVDPGNFTAWPRVKALLDELLGVYRPNILIPARQREDALLIKVEQAILQLEQLGTPRTVMAIGPHCDRCDRDRARLHARAPRTTCGHDAVTRAHPPAHGEDPSMSRRQAPPQLSRGGGRIAARPHRPNGEPSARLCRTQCPRIDISAVGRPDLRDDEPGAQYETGAARRSRTGPTTAFATASSRSRSHRAGDQRGRAAPRAGTRPHAAARGDQAARAREPRRRLSATRHVRLADQHRRPDAISDVRAVLEGHAAYRAAELLARRGRGRARGARHRARRVPDSDDPQALMALDARVHRFVHHARRPTPISRRRSARYFNLSLRIWYLVLERLPHLAARVHDHGDLLEAIGDRDPFRARAVMVEHIETFAGEIRGVL